MRARIGVWVGSIDRVLPHGTSGRADYLGSPANRAARLMAAAQGGQVHLATLFRNSVAEFCALLRCQVTAR